MLLKVPTSFKTIVRLIFVSKHLLSYFYCFSFARFSFFVDVFLVVLFFRIATVIPFHDNNNQSTAAASLLQSNKRKSSLHKR